MLVYLVKFMFVYINKSEDQDSPIWWCYNDLLQSNEQMKKESLLPGTKDSKLCGTELTAPPQTLWRIRLDTAPRQWVNSTHCSHSVGPAHWIKLGLFVSRL